MQKLIFILLFFPSFLLFGQSDKRLKGLEKQLEEVLSTSQTAGFAVAVVENNNILYAKGFGYRDYENKIAVDENTLFAIGSCTKAFTTSLLGMLENDDLLSFEDPPSKYVSELSFSNAATNGTVTIRDLIAHRTGMPRHDYSWYLFPSDSKDSLMMRISYQEPFADLREKWYYNNFMYLTQGVIAERITGKTWEDNIKEKFFKPLGMTRSGISSYEAEKTPNAAFGYGLKQDKITKLDYYRISGMSPAGSIYSSVTDMAQWLKVWVNNGMYNDEEFLPANYVRQAISSQMVINGGLPTAENPDLFFANYGFAWALSSYKGHYRVEHGGNIDGFSASTSFFPSDSIGIVVLSNQDGSRIPSIVRNIVADYVLQETKTDWNQQRIDQEKASKEAQDGAEAASSRVTGTSPTHIPLEMTGTYENKGYGSFTITASQDSLYANFKRAKLWLNHYHYNTFELYEVSEDGIDTTDSSPTRMNFIVNEMGDIAKMEMQMEPALADPIEFKRTPGVVAVSEVQLKAYEGSYQLGGMSTKIFIKGETLFFFVPGQGDYELIPVGEHLFAVKQLSGFKVQFLADEDGSINALNAIQPNGTFKAEKVE